MRGNNNIQSNKVIYWKLTKKSTKFYQQCNIKNNLISTDSFTSFTIKETWKFYQKSNFRIQKVIYLLGCTFFQKQYIGKSKWPFYLRLDNCRHRIKSMEKNNLILVEHCFCTNGYDFNRHAKFTIIERMY